MNKLLIGTLGAIAICLSTSPVRANESSLTESIESLAGRALDMCLLHTINFKSTADYDYDKATYVCRDFSMNYGSAIQDIADASYRMNSKDLVFALKRFDDLYAPVTLTITNTPSGLTRMIERDLAKYQ